MEVSYSIRTWDCDAQAYTPQDEMAWNDLTLWQLRMAMRALRQDGYSVHRRGNCRDGHDNNDAMVLIEKLNQ